MAIDKIAEKVKSLLCSSYKGNCACCPDYDGECDGILSDEAKAIAALIAEEQRPLVEALKAMIAWNERYPTTRIYGEQTIKRIAAEMDEICEQAKKAVEGMPQVGMDEEHTAKEINAFNRQLNADREYLMGELK